MTNGFAETTTTAAVDRKRVVFTMGGKGGVGKTAVASALAGWYEHNEIPVTMLDLDSENKAVGSLKHYYAMSSKVDINTPAGLDVFVDRLMADDGVPIVLADMGSGAGQVTNEWFNQMYDSVAGLVAFTAVGIVTPDPASVDSVLAWADRLQTRVEYLIVENAVSLNSKFEYWDNTREACRFREVFKPLIVRAEYRLAELEHASRQHGFTLRAVAARQANVAELAKASLVIRAQGYQKRLFAEFDRATRLLIP